MAPLAGQGSAAPSPWVAFYGCWEADGAARGAQLTCVLPSDRDREARVVTVRDGVVQREQTLLADGRAYRSAEGDCDGSESRSVAADGAWIVLRGELRCGTRDAQRLSGLHAIVDGDWLEIESLASPNGQPMLRVVRRKALAWSAMPAVAGEGLGSRERSVASARAAAHRPLDASRVLALAGAVDAAVAEAWMLESARGRHGALRIDRGDLVAFAAADVPAGVIDLAVALANPRDFHLDVGGRPMPVAALAGAEAGGAGGAPFTPMPMMNCFVPPYMGIGMMPYINCMDVGAYPFVSQWGFTRWGTYPGFFPGYGYPVVVVQPGGSVRPPQDNGGRVIRGQGYTQHGASGSGSAQPRGSSSPSVRSGGQGSRGTSTGRTAKPRNP